MCWALSFSEGAIIATVGLFGPPVAFAVLFVGCSAISILIAYAFDAEEAKHGAAPLVGRTRAWIARKRTRAEERAQRLAHLSEATAFVVLSVTVGPFLTAIVIKVRGADRRAAYLMCVDEQCDLLGGVGGRLRGRPRRAREGIGALDVESDA